MEQFLIIKSKSTNLLGNADYGYLSNVIKTFYFLIIKSKVYYQTDFFSFLSFIFLGLVFILRHVYIFFWVGKWIKSSISWMILEELYTKMTHMFAWTKEYCEMGHWHSLPQRRYFPVFHFNLCSFFRMDLSFSSLQCYKTSNLLFGLFIFFHRMHSPLQWITYFYYKQQALSVAALLYMNTGIITFSIKCSICTDFILIYFTVIVRLSSTNT